VQWQGKLPSPPIAAVKQQKKKKKKVDLLQGSNRFCICKNIKSYYIPSFHA